MAVNYSYAKACRSHATVFVGWILSPGHVRASHGKHPLQHFTVTHQSEEHSPALSPCCCSHMAVQPPTSSPWGGSTVSQDPCFLSGPGISVLKETDGRAMIPSLGGLLGPVTLFQGHMRVAEVLHGEGLSGAFF